MALSGATVKAIKDYQISDFSDSELKTLCSLVGRFGQKEIDIKGVFNELGGNKEMCAKFQRLCNLAANDSTLQARIVRMKALEEKATALQFRIGSHESAISSSRSRTASSITADVAELSNSAKVKF